MDDYLQWILRNTQASGMQQEQDQSRQKLPGQLAQQSLENQLRQQELTKLEGMNPQAILASKLRNQETQFGLGQKQFDEPQRQFASTVGTYGPQLAGQMMANAQPERFSQGSEFGPPDIRGNATEAAKLLYSMGPETARAINQAGMTTENALPFKLAEQAPELQNRKDVANITASAHLATAGAAAREMGETRKEERAAKAADKAYLNFKMNPAHNTVNTLRENALETGRSEKELVKDLTRLSSVYNTIISAKDESIGLGKVGGADNMLGEELSAQAERVLAELRAIDAQLRKQLEESRKGILDRVNEWARAK